MVGEKIFELGLVLSIMDLFRILSHYTRNAHHCVIKRTRMDDKAKIMEFDQKFNARF